MKCTNSNNMQTVFYWMLIAVTVFISCSKDKSNQVSRLELLTRNDWIIQKAEEKTGGNP